MRQAITGEDVEKFVNQLDHYQMHWLMHFLHAVEIVGYHHPHAELRAWWHDLYLTIVDALHLRPESFEDNQTRLQDGNSRNCWKTQPGRRLKYEHRRSRA